MPEVNQGATVQEIRQSYEAEKTALVMRCFDLALEGAYEGVKAANELAADSSRDIKETYFVERGEAYAAGLRDEIKTRYAELDAEMKVAVTARVGIIESELLAPSKLDPAALIAAAGMSEDALLSAIEIADDLGDEGEDALLLLFKVARENDVDSAVTKVMTLREDIAELMQELAEADAVPELNADDAFETYAADAPSGREILGTAQKDLDLVSRF